MAPLVISLSALPSRVARTAIAGVNGARTIATRASTNTTSTGGSISGLFGNVFAFGRAIVAQAFQMVIGAGINFVQLFQGLVRNFRFIWNFNWSTSDVALDAQVKGSYQALAGALGGTLGTAMGRLVCGAAPAALVATINEPLAVALLLAQGEQALDEVSAKVASVIQLTAKSVFQTGLVAAYKNIRAVLRPDGAKLRTQLKAAGVLTEEQIAKAVEERDKPWSFASAFEAGIKAIPNDYVEQMVQSFVDEFAENCIEAGYIVASTLDAQLPTFFASFNAVLGGTTTVSIVP